MLQQLLQNFTSLSKKVIKKSINGIHHLNSIQVILIIIVDIKKEVRIMLLKQLWCIALGSLSNAKPYLHKVQLHSKAFAILGICYRICRRSSLKQITSKAVLQIGSLFSKHDKCRVVTTLPIYTTLKSLSTSMQHMSELATTKTTTLQNLIIVTQATHE